MAVQELLKASYTGSLGETTGAKWKNRDVVKGKIWSKTPNNETQTSSVRAFEALNRVSAVIAKQFFYRLGISAKNMHKHNAVARLLKAAVATHEFTPEAFLDTFHENGDVSISGLAVDRTAGSVSFTFSTTLDLSATLINAAQIIVFRQNGQVLYSELPNVSEKAVSFFAPLTEEDSVYALAIGSRKENGKYVLSGYLAASEIGVVGVTLSLAASAVNRTDANDTVTLAASVALPAGSHSVTITTRAARQGRFADTSISATLITDGTNTVTLQFVPGADTLDQKDVFVSDGYIAIEKGKIVDGDTSYRWNRTAVSPVTSGEINYTLTETPAVEYDGTQYVATWSSPFTAAAMVNIPACGVHTVNDSLEDTVVGIRAGVLDGTVRTATRATLQPIRNIVWASSQKPTATGSQGRLSVLLENVNQNWQSEQCTFSPMSTRLTRTAIENDEWQFVATYTFTGVVRTKAMADDLPIADIKTVTFAKETDATTTLAVTATSGSNTQTKYPNMNSFGQAPYFGFSVGFDFGITSATFQYAFTADKAGAFLLKVAQATTSTHLVGITLAYPFAATA